MFKAFIKNSPKSTKKSSHVEFPSNEFSLLAQTFLNQKKP